MEIIIGELKNRSTEIIQSQQQKIDLKKIKEYRTVSDERK